MYSINKIAMARKYVVQLIYDSAKLEGIALTFQDTEMLLEGYAVRAKISDVICINNIKHAWQFIFDSYSYPMDYQYLCKINQIVDANLISSPGYLRKINVWVTGIPKDVWMPDLPDEVMFINEFNNVLRNPDPIDRALDAMLFIMRSQPFIDANKRTANLCANQILIQNDAGLISIDEENQEEFKRLVIDFYISGDSHEIKGFLKDKCLWGPWDIKEETTKLPPTSFFYNKEN